MANNRREGFHTVTPYLMARDVDGLVNFVKQAFGATETFRAKGSAGGWHIEVRIGDSMIMIGGGGAWNGDPPPSSIYLYVDDVDAIYHKALEAGATSIAEIETHDDGDRRGGVQDPTGHQWWVATYMGSDD